MRFLSLLPLALSAHSLLVPPQPGDGYSEVKSLPEVKSADQISLSCEGGCPSFRDIAHGHGLVRVWENSPNNKLGVNVHAAGGKVFFNEHQIWPQVPISEGLSVISLTDEQSTHEEILLPISTAIEWKAGTFVTDGHDFVKTNPISLEILAVANQVVHAEKLEITVATTANGVGIHSLSVSPYEASPLIDSCTNILCRVQGTIALKYNQWRKAMANKFKGLRGCGRKAGHKAGGMRLKGGPNKFGPGATLHPHKHHGHHHSRVGFMTVLGRVVKTFVIPVALVTYVVLMVCSIVKIAIPHIRRVRAARRGEYVEVKQSEAEEGRASIDGPPKYEDVISEEQTEKVDEKK